MIDYYKILGIEPTKDKDEIKKAFRRLAHIHHPDKGGDKKKFQEILNAYEILMKAAEDQVQQKLYGFPIDIIVNIVEPYPDFWYQDYGYYDGTGTTAGYRDRTN